ncbi:hypothetical protein [Kamptonema formosum]|uniref:hypothetical protein n=1 Tax=Kamptonema formosum TaxID=331992 RepID=UPI00034C7167|nr:hypothetical protein [Oscillatoria sp. PCC 10802]
MGKFDSVFNSEDPTTLTLAPEEAVAAIATVCKMATSNNQLELERAARLLLAFDLFEEYSKEEVSTLIKRLAKIAVQDGLGAVFNQAYDSLPYEQVPDAFAASIVMLAAEKEGELEDEEVEAICELQDALGLDDEEADYILDEVIAELSGEWQEGEEGEQEVRTFQAGPTDRDLAEIVVGVYEEPADTELYESPAGNFTVPVPTDPEKGGSISAQDGSVAFSDDFGTLLRIDYTPFTLKVGDRIQLVGREEFFKTFLTHYVSQAILAYFPGSQILGEEYIDDLMDGAYFIAADMPQGSTISKQTGDGSEVRMNAYRGFVCFIAAGFVYTVSDQRHFWDEETPGPLAEEIEDIKNSLFDFIDTIAFVYS